MFLHKLIDIRVSRGGVYRFMTVTYSKFTVVYQDVVYDFDGNGLHYLSTHKRIPTWLVQQIKTELAQQAKRRTICRTSIQ